MNVLKITPGDIANIDGEYRVYWGDCIYSYYIADTYQAALNLVEKIKNPVIIEEESASPIAKFFVAFIFLSGIALFFMCFPSAFFPVLIFALIILGSISFAL